MALYSTSRSVANFIAIMKRCRNLNFIGGKKGTAMEEPTYNIVLNEEGKYFLEKVREKEMLVMVVVGLSLLFSNLKIPKELLREMCVCELRF